MTKGIYAVRDRVAQEIVGQILLFPHDAVAVRFFQELAEDQNTAIHRHLRDHDLIKCGTYDTQECSVEGMLGGYTVILSGEAVAAMRETEGAAHA